MKFNKLQEVKKFEKEVIKAKIINSGGSVPSESGNYMLISEEDIFGTIGGGHLEYLVINKENVVNKSKAVGEPPFMLALSVFMALKDAIKNENKKSTNLKAPATAENILLNIN